MRRVWAALCPRPRQSPAAVQVWLGAPDEAAPSEIEGVCDLAQAAETVARRYPTRDFALALAPARLACQPQALGEAPPAQWSARVACAATLRLQFLGRVNMARDVAAVRVVGAGGAVADVTPRRFYSWWLRATPQTAWFTQQQCRELLRAAGARADAGSAAAVAEIEFVDGRVLRLHDGPAAPRALYLVARPEAPSQADWTLALFDPDLGPGVDGAAG